MKKVVVASLLAVAGMACVAGTVAAQTPVNLGSQQPASGGVQMSPAEYNAYNSAITQTDPKAKAAALEAYLTAYPQSAVKAATLEQLMLAYSAFDAAKTTAGCTMIRLCCLHVQVTPEASVTHLKEKIY